MTGTAAADEERSSKVAAVRLRFQRATSDLAAEKRFGGPDASATELEMLEEATRLVKASLGARAL